MTLLSDRHGDPAGPTAKLKDRPAGAPREAAEPLDVGSSLERGVIEVVQRGQAGGLGGLAFGALPVTRCGRGEPPSRV
jgi:hypothetical protein